MESFKSSLEISQKGAEKMSNLEKKKDLVKRMGDLHKYLDNKFKEIDEKRSTLTDKYKPIPFDRNRMNFKKTSEYMSAEDFDLDKKLNQENEELYHKINKIILEAFNLLFEDKDAHWQKQPSLGVPGSLVERESRDYRSKLDDIYALEISWSNYSESPQGGPENAREEYYAKIKGFKEIVIKKGIGGIIGRKTEKRYFPTTHLGITQNDDRVFEPNKMLREDFNEPTRIKFQKQLLELGKRLREQLG